MRPPTRLNSFPWGPTSWPDWRTSAKGSGNGLPPRGCRPFRTSSTGCPNHETFPAGEIGKGPSHGGGAPFPLPPVPDDGRNDPILLPVHGQDFLRTCLRPGRPPLCRRSPGFPRFGWRHLGPVGAGPALLRPRDVESRPFGHGLPDRQELPGRNRAPEPLCRQNQNLLSRLFRPTVGGGSPL